MPYPPTVTPINRSNSTAMLDNHKNDHNEAEDALTSIIAKIGNAPSSVTSFATMDARYTAYGKGATIIVAHSTSTDAWQEAADYVIDNTSPATNITTINTALASLNTTYGGGKLLFAPTVNSHYILGAISGTPLITQSDTIIEFMGGTGATVDGSTAVQAYFGSGVWGSVRSGIILGNGVYLVGIAGATGFGNPLSGIFVYGSGDYGFYLGNPTGTPAQTKIMCHSGAGASLAVVDIYGTSTSTALGHVRLENIQIDGSSLGVPGIRATNAALINGSNVQIFDTAIATNGKGAGLVLNNVWDSFFNECRWDWCGSVGRSSSIASGVEANIRGAIHFSDTAGASNNVQFTNCTIETTFDRAIHMERPTAAAAGPNKCYFNNIKIESSVMYNSSLIYMDGVTASTVTNLDVTSGTTAALSSITATPIWDMKNCSSIVVDRYNMELTADAIARTVTGAASATTTQNIATLGSASMYVGWTVKILVNSAGTAVGTTTTISSHTNSVAVLAASWTLAASAQVEIYPQNVSSFLRLNGGNTNISIGNFIGSSQPYRSPTIAWVDFNSTTDLEIIRAGQFSLYYNGDSANIPYPQMVGGTYSGTSGFQQIYNGTVDTTNNTNTTILTIPLQVSTAYVVQHVVIGRRTGGSGADGDGGADVKSAVVTVTSTGVPARTAIASTSAGVSGTAVTYTPTYVMNTSTTNPSITIQVQGPATTNVTWSIRVTLTAAGL